jgi:hypothetical protein
MPAFALLALPLALQAATPIENLELLQQRMEAAAGTALRPLDPRLRLVRCPESLAITTGPHSVIAYCAELGWRVHAVPLSPLDQYVRGPIVRRGDPVTLRIPGRGFAVVLRTVALEDAAIGARVRLRRTTGPTTPLIGIVTAAGEAQPAG